MLSDERSIAKSECRVILSQLDKLLIISKHLRIFLELCPIQGVDVYRGVKAVVHTLFITQHFFTAQNERNALRSEHCSLCKQVETNEFIVLNVGDRSTKAVGQAHIVMTADIANLLGRLYGPWLLAVVYL